MLANTRRAQTLFMIGLLLAATVLWFATAPFFLQGGGE